LESVVAAGLVCASAAGTIADAVRKTKQKNRLMLNLIELRMHTRNHSDWMLRRRDGVPLFYPVSRRARKNSVRAENYKQTEVQGPTECGLSSWVKEK
jgi:hypothetical protein